MHIKEEEIPMEETMKKESVFHFDAHEVLEVHPASLGDDLIDWGLQVIMAPMAWQKTKGEGVKVAILDTGVDFNHRDLIQNIRATINFTDSRYGTLDINGHGTHVAGIIAAVDNQIGMIGVAPQAELYCAKVLSDTGGGKVESIIKGIRWAIANQVDIINMSLGTPVEPGNELHETIKQAVNQGIIIICATGNNNGEVCWPAAYDETIAVSAMNNKYERAEFSNYGIKNEIIAPGVDILSTYKNGTYAKLSGTSMATPIISGSAALFVSYYKKIYGKRPTVQEVHQALLNATVDLGKDGKDEYFGAGLINLAKLLNL
jgi:subtilisin family serine protease